jgi:hypothetical protein
MPWVQRAIPRWHNPDELEAVAAAVSLLRPREGILKPPTLAILSPYSEQVRRLKQVIDEKIDSFPWLKLFRPAVGPAEYCGTVDSFQGNEADVVVVSLVRNNHHSGAKSALGFLSDPRHMNVLLSRARWRMILVGSFEFLESVLKSASKTEAGPDIAFLGRLLSSLAAEGVKGRAVTLGSDSLIRETAT